MRRVLDQICKENRNTHFLYSITFLRKFCLLYDNVDYYDGARQVTDYNKMRRMRFVCWITKATDTHSEYVYFLPLHSNNSFANEPYCYVTRELPLLNTCLLYCSKYN